MNAKDGALGRWSCEGGDGPLAVPSPVRPGCGLHEIEDGGLHERASARCASVALAHTNTNADRLRATLRQRPVRCVCAQDSWRNGRRGSVTLDPEAGKVLRTPRKRLRSDPAPGRCATKRAERRPGAAGHSLRFHGDISVLQVRIQMGITSGRRRAPGREASELGRSSFASADPKYGPDNSVLG